MKVNCHIDPNIEEEHLDLFVREMNPQISNLLKSFTSTEPVLWCYDADQIKSNLPNDFIEASCSTIFNYHYLDHLELLDNGLIDAILTNGSHIQISRRKIKNLKARLGL